MWRESGWRADPWSDLGLEKGRGRALVSQGSCCGPALPQSLAAPASEEVLVKDHTSNLIKCKVVKH